MASAPLAGADGDAGERVCGAARGCRGRTGAFDPEWTHRLTIGSENTDSSNHRGRTMVDEDEPRQGAPEVVSFAPTA